jgi:hypothetical protein
MLGGQWKVLMFGGQWKVTIFGGCEPWIMIQQIVKL